MVIIYNLKYISDNGNTINFSPAQSWAISNVDGLTAVSVSFATSQGIGQVGATIQGESIEENGRPITIEGAMLGISTQRRELLLKTVVPGIGGRLIFDNTWFVDTRVENSPDISRHKYGAEFQFQLRAPYPYWRLLEQSSEMLSGIESKFRFPVNYATPHTFGIRKEEAYKNLYNDGSVPIPFIIRFFAKTAVTNPKIVNVKTLKFIRIEKTMAAGEIINIDMMQTPVSITSTISNTTTKAIKYFDIDSTFFKLETGENLIMSDADVNESGLYCTIIYNIATAGVWGDDNTYV